MDEKEGPAARAMDVEGIDTGNVAFEKSPPEWCIGDAGHLPLGRFVAHSGGVVLGWAALRSVSGRCAYSGVAEVSVYAARASRGQGIGIMLWAALVVVSEREGIWTLQSGIFPENVARVELQKRLGFRIVGTRGNLGSMNGRWRGVLWMEGRSTV